MELIPNRELSRSEDNLLKVLNYLNRPQCLERLNLFARDAVSCEDWIKGEMLFGFDCEGLYYKDRPRIKKNYFADIAFSENELDNQLTGATYVEIKIWHHCTQSQYAKSTANDIDKLLCVTGNGENYLVIFVLTGQ